MGACTTTVEQGALDGYDGKRAITESQTRVAAKLYYITGRGRSGGPSLW